MNKVFYFKTLSSTNSKAKSLAKKGFDKVIVIADKQTSGKGRFKRKWVSSLGGLYMTILLKEKDLSRVKYLTFIASIAVAKTIKLNSKVKWPNDVLISGKKICGILTETVYKQHSVSDRRHFSLPPPHNPTKDNYALIGIGVNVNQKKFSKDISDKATSLTLETNKEYDIKKIINEIVKEFNSLYKYYNNKKYNEIIKIWKKYSCTLGKKIRAETLSGVYVGKAVGVDEDCNLVLKLKNGKRKKIIEGDIFTV
jgi:BirA family biotin operon repressor/biotin-[acetyl-CoA-carboxylase] ligase|tara:strand:- start:192 stop:950 length:759 start_codon:yes stop_codon:yes gene_type:complete